MAKPSYKSYFSSYFGIFVGFLNLTVIQCAPQNVRSSILGEVFEEEGGGECLDLKKMGYEGFECTLQSSCGDDGYITRSTIDSGLAVFSSYEDYEYEDESKVLDLSKYACPNLRQYDYDYYSDDKIVCCRSPEYYGKDSPPNSASETCAHWEEFGFDCVQQDVCEEDGHYTTKTDQEAVGVRKELFLQKDDKFTRARKAKCQNADEVCCRRDDFYAKDLDVSAVTEKTAVNENFDSMPVGSSLGKDPVCQLSIRKVQDDLLPRISGTSGAQEAQFGDWPNMCIVLKESEFNGDSFDLYQCGASLIAPGIVLTAAHCVDGKDVSKIKVRCGELDAKLNYTESASERKPHQDRHAKHISVHPTFNNKNLYYDFALVHTDIEFELDEHIYPICLPNQHETLPLYNEGDCYAMGYGKDSFGADGYFSDVLKVAPMSTVDSYECQSNYQLLKPKFQLHKSFLCAEGEGIGTCFGDGGSPLLCPNDKDDYVQVGVVAWGEKGCSGDKPDVFSDVSKALGFIDWATKCVEGQDVDLFGLSYFNRWAKRQYCINKNNIDDIKTQLQFSNHPNEVNLRKEWRQYDYENRRLRAAIKGCKTGPKDLDCKIHDYISNEYEFNEQAIRNTAAIKSEYKDFVKNDVVERSSFSDIVG